MASIGIYRERILPASETFVAGQIRAIRRHDPFLIGMLHDASGRDLVSEIPKVVLQDHASWNAAWRELQRLGGRIHPRLLSLVAERRPSMLHAHFGYDAVWALPLARRLGVPMVATFHGWDFAICRGRRVADGGVHYPLYVRRRGELFSYASRILAPSRYTGRRLEEIGCPPEKIAVHPIGIDLARFRQQSPTRREPTVLFVARLVRQKGCDYLIRAMARLRDRHPDWSLVVVGDGSEKGRLELLAREKGVRHVFTGSLPPASVRELMSHASILCVPSLSRRCGCGESFGLVFAEAQAAGLPVVAFAQGGLPEAVGPGGILVRERDENELTVALDELIRDEALRVRLVAAGTSHVTERFDIRALTSALEDRYDEILGRTLQPRTQ